MVTLIVILFVSFAIICFSIYRNHKVKERYKYLEELRKNNEMWDEFDEQHFS